MDVSPQKKGRLIALDLFRGITITAMILVNNPGNPARVYPPLKHAEWAAITPTDLVFPFFLFIAGVALTMTLRPYLRVTGADQPQVRSASLYIKIFRRAALLVLLGLLLNAFPDFNWATWRIPGVLQRIGICYLISALILLHIPLTWQWASGAVILAAYAALLHFASAPGVAAGQLLPAANLPRWFDRTVFGVAHVFPYWPTEPEGLLSTPAAVVTTLLGSWTGLWLVRRIPSGRTWPRLMLLGGLFVLAGWAWGAILPMVKMIWTPSYVLFTGGWSMIFLAGCGLIVEVKGAGKWIWIFEVLGRNAILAYVLSELAGALLRITLISGTTLPEIISRDLGQIAGRGVIPSEMASLFYALLFTVTVWVVLFFPYRRRWYLRI